MFFSILLLMILILLIVLVPGKTGPRLNNNRATQGMFSLGAEVLNRTESK